MSKITCLLCNKDFGQITAKHLLLRHNLNSLKEYIDMFPHAQTYVPQIYSDERRETQRKNRLGYKHSDETKERIGKSNLGKIMPRDAVERQKISLKKYYAENGSHMTGKDRGQAFKDKMSQIAKNRDPELVKQKVEQMLTVRRGSKATPEQKQRYSDARLKYIEENPDCLPKTLFNTKPERDFAEELDKRNILYKKSFVLGGRVFDFKINNNILVEIDGPYHWNIDMYGSKSTSIEKKQEKFNKTIAIDHLKNQIAKDNNFKIFRIKVGSDLWNSWYEQLQEQGWDLF